ncbi:MAG: radical SAM protein [Candidatus Omnitrophica bacterium]|nr:radical SAM protein [Candidatus Omnitrophota bacterium]
MIKWLSMMKNPELIDLTLEITNRCNLRCRCCGIWKERRPRSLPLSAIEYLTTALLKNVHINSVALTGGEPFLHPQLAAILRFFHILKLKKLVRAVGIYSNGFDHRRIIGFLEAHRRILRGVSLGISLDGLEGHHDALRGRAGAFNASMKTIDYIAGQCMGLVKPSVKFTINRRNYGDLSALYFLAKSRGFRFMPKLAEFEASAYYHRVSCRVTDLDWNVPVVKGQIIRRLDLISADLKSSATETADARVISCLKKMARLGPRAIKSCRTPESFLFVTCAGEFYPCLYMPPISSLKRHFLQDVFGPEHLERIRRGRQGRCPRCYAYHGFLKAINLKEA